METISLPLCKDNLIFKRQSPNSEVIWLYIKIEKTLQTKDYNDSYEYIETPIMRFNINSQVGKYMELLYGIDYNLIK